MGEGNHLPAASVVNRPKRRLMWLSGGAVVAVAAAGLLMQYVRSSVTQAANDPPAGTKTVSSAPKKPLLARVGDESITYEAVADEAVKRYGREVLDDLIHRLIIQQACEKNQISVTEQEISAEIERIAGRFKLDVTQWQQMLQAERNITPVQYRQSVIFPMIAMKKLAGKDVDVTEKDMKEAFVRNYGPRVKARMIMYKTQRQATAGWEYLKKNPDDFENVATKDSVDPGSRALGGQIPPIARYSGNEYLENMEKAAFQLKKDDISGVIEVAPDRYVIIKCEGRTEQVVNDIEEVRDTLYEELKEAKIQIEVAKVFDKIKKDTIVDNYLTQTSNRAERNANAPAAGGSVQPAGATQIKTGVSPAKAVSAPPKATRSQ